MAKTLAWAMPSAGRNDASWAARARVASISASHTTSLLKGRGYPRRAARRADRGDPRDGLLSVTRRIVKSLPAVPPPRARRRAHGPGPPRARGPRQRRPERGRHLRWQPGVWGVVEAKGALVGTFSLLWHRPKWASSAAWRSSHRCKAAVSVAGCSSTLIRPADAPASAPSCSRRRPPARTSTQGDRWVIDAQELRAHSSSAAPPPPRVPLY